MKERDRGKCLGRGLPRPPTVWPKSPLRRLIEAQRELTKSFDDKPPLWTEKSPGQGRWSRGLGRPINRASVMRQRKLAKPLITHGARVRQLGDVGGDAPRLIIE